ncbi:Tetratricopeptide repeat protein [Candidatus Sulfotelmatobacter kueseliae]|uniref:Tetratricopeptide repeat protein n=1 Tax=Candidatus Sulfotelmatobacter kueseliae TaxID=2042962 RepID=A0A2U3KXU9_9BACT|nr:Tetratricopeptide repeat protein [Candidatus Sulfotelmatobacter kueseliae]
MTDMNETKGGSWTPTQAYVLSVICLVLGVAIGYLGRGSGATPAAAPANGEQIRAGAGMDTGRMAPGGTVQAPTPDQLRQMADVQVQPLLAQLESDPNNPKLLYQIGNIYYDSQQYPEAVKYYESCLRIDPKATDVRTDLGTAYHLMGQPDKAIREYDEVLKVDGTHANALLNEGMVKWQDKMDLAGAIASWKRLLEVHPDYPQRDRVQHMIDEAEQHLSMKSGASGKSTSVAQ